MASKQTVRLGVIGAGRIGLIHAENIALALPDAELAWVFDPDQRAAGACVARCREGRIATDPRQLLDDPEVEAVVICSPTSDHAEQIELAAAAGKQIFCEKPIDLDLQRIDQALAAVERAGIKLQVGFNRRFDPSFRRARELVATGRIGAPQLVRITSRDPGPPPPEYIRRSGGMFVDMTIHDFDIARWIVGDEVAELHAMAGNLVDPAIGALDDIDTAVVSLRYESGALGAIDNSRKAAYGYDQRVEVFGSAGSVAVANVAETTVVTSGEAGVVADRPLHFFLERYREAYREEMRAFIRALIEDREVDVGGADGRAAVALAAAADRSRREGTPQRLLP